MSFYSSIAKYYDHIFPFNKAQLRFITENTTHHASSTLLEIGAATGLLTAACSDAGYKIQGLELDKDMVNIAQRHYPELVFRCGNMLNLDTLYQQKFTILICFGNTLVHLPSEREITHFLNKAAQSLEKEGRLMIQFINYDRVLNKHINALPPIDNNIISFKRNYHNVSDTSLDFDTELKIHKTGEILTNTQRLYPLRKKRFEQLALDAGFTTQVFGSFTEDPWTLESLQSLFICAKQ